MNVLFLDHPQFTAGSYLLWHGLKELERDGYPINIMLLPHIPTHFNTDKFNVHDMGWYLDLEKTIAEKKLPWGIPPFSPGEVLTYDGQEEVKRFVSSQRFQTPEWTPTLSQVAEKIQQGKFDLIILANSHRVPTILLGQLRDMVLPAALPPIVYYDAGERDELCEHWVHVFHPKITFKQILTPEVEQKGLSCPIANYNFKILPLPLSSILVDYPDQKFSQGGLTIGSLLEQDIDAKFLEVFYQMGITWPERQALMDRMNALLDRLKVVHLGAMTYPNFHLVLSRSRMGVTMRGSGRDTFRYWEIPLYRTAMVCDGTMGCIHPFPFEDGKTALFWRSLDELEMVIQDHLSGKPGATDVQRVGSAGQVHLKKFHSTKARAMFFLNRVQEHLKIGESLTLHTDWVRPWRGPAV